MDINDPQILNMDNDANQPDFFDIAISENRFDFSFIEAIHIDEELKVNSENERFFGTHIKEAKKTLKELFKK